MEFTVLGLRGEVEIYGLGFFSEMCGLVFMRRFKGYVELSVILPTMLDKPDSSLLK